MGVLADDDAVDEMLRELIATALRQVADKVCREQTQSITQEHQITSRIGEALTQRMRQWGFGGYRVQVVTQDFPDHGPGALEKAVGADLYVGMRVTRRGRTVISKGTLAQAKLGQLLTPRTRQGLIEQCERLLLRTNSAVVWVYTKAGVRVINAADVVRRSSRNLTGGRRLDELFSETLACHEGDPAIGLPTGRLSQGRVGLMLEGLRVSKGIAIEVGDGESDD